MRLVLLLLLLFLPDPGPLLSQPAARPTRVRLRLVDLSLVPDTTYGLQLLLQPAPGTVAEGTAGALVWLRFDPDTVFAWLNSAAAILQVPAPGGPVHAIQWSPTLRPLDRRGGFLLGRERSKGILRKARWLAVAADSTPGWQAELAASEADSLLRLFLALAPHSRVDTSEVAVPDQAHVDEPVTILQQSHAPSGGARGSVAVQYVVDRDGRAEMESLSVLLASSDRLASDAREMIRTARFTPARKHGQPVRQLVQQLIVSR